MWKIIVWIVNVTITATWQIKLVSVMIANMVSIVISGVFPAIKDTI